MPARRSGEVFEAALEKTLEAEAPFHWPQWPTSRSFKPPPPQIIPVGPPRTFSPCGAVTNDPVKLSPAADYLKSQLRQKPPNPQRANNRSGCRKGAEQPDFSLVCSSSLTYGSDVFGIWRCSADR
jgi:hypothetical protein